MSKQHGPNPANPRPMKGALPFIGNRLDAIGSADLDALREAREP